VRVVADAIVNWGALGKVIVASLVAGVGATLCFSLAIMGTTRFAELRRDGRSTAAGAYAALGLLGFAVTIAAVVAGIVVMTKKG
jgi:hypothetical protein